MNKNDVKKACKGVFLPSDDVSVVDNRFPRNSFLVTARRPYRGLVMQTQRIITQVDEKFLPQALGRMSSELAAKKKELDNEYKPKYIALVGVPGSGKSTLAHEYEGHGFMRLNRDSLRTELFGENYHHKIPNQDGERLVTERITEMRNKFMAGRHDIVDDNTNLSPARLEPALTAAKKAGYELQIIIIDPFIEVCLDRNASRDRVVPEHVVRDMYAKLSEAIYQEKFEELAHRMGAELTCRD